MHEIKHEKKTKKKNTTTLVAPQLCVGEEKDES